MMLRIVFLLLAGLMTTAANAVIQDASVTYPAQDASGNDLSGCTLRMHLFWDDAFLATGNYHKMLHFHGGAWVFGDELQSYDPNNPDKYPSAFIKEFTSKGFLIASASYRLLRKTANDGAWDPDQAYCPLPSTEDMLRDTEYAYSQFMAFIAFINGLNSSTPNVINTSERTMLVGESAGAHLVMMLASRLNDPNNLAVVANSGPIDFMDLWVGANSGHYRYNVTDVNVNWDKDRVLTVGSVPIQTGDIGIPQSALDLFAISTPGNNGCVDASCFDGAFMSSAASNGWLKENTFRLNAANMPPVYLLVGSDDSTVPPEQSIIYCQSLGFPTHLASESNVGSDESCPLLKARRNADGTVFVGGPPFGMSMESDPVNGKYVIDNYGGGWGDSLGIPGTAHLILDGWSSLDIDYYNRIFTCGPASTTRLEVAICGGHGPYSRPGWVRIENWFNSIKDVH